MKEKIDKYDIALSISSGALTATMDALWIGDISFAEAHEWGSKQIDEFVKKVARWKTDYKGNDITGAIRALEKEFPMDGDLLTKEFGSGAYHHLRDFCHHPTPVGLLFSILMEFTGKGFGTDSTGKFVIYEIPDWKRRRTPEAIYMGTVSWLFHIISDLAGSSGTRQICREGTGVPGPLLSFLKEISSLPGIRSIMGKTDVKNSSNKKENYQFSVTCSKLFDGTLLGEHDENGKIVHGGQLRFDFRTEFGIVHESIENKQYIPVLLNEIIVAAFYSVRRFMMQLETCGCNSLDALKNINISKCLPWKNTTVRHMRMIATSTFTAIDLSVAGIKAALKNKNNPSGFALDFMQGINYWGLGSFALATNSEFMLALKKMQVGFLAAAETQKQAVIKALPNGQETWDTGRFAIEAAISITNIGTPIGFISATIGVYDEIKKATRELDLAKEERIRIQKECTERIEMIQEYRAEMSCAVSDYLYEKMNVFAQAFAAMDQAINENDVEAFILGNHMIQTEIS